MNRESTGPASIPSNGHVLRIISMIWSDRRFRNEHVRGSVKVVPVTKKITEKRLKWNGQVKRRDEGHVGPTRRTLDAPVNLPGQRRRRQKPRWGKKQVEKN